VCERERDKERTRPSESETESEGQRGREKEMSVCMRERGGEGGEGGETGGGDEKEQWDQLMPDLSIPDGVGGAKGSIAPVQVKIKAYKTITATTPKPYFKKGMLDQFLFVAYHKHS